MPYFGTDEERVWGLTGWITAAALDFIHDAERVH
jgi:hypothetical protein